MSQITTHVLDTSLGQPATGVSISLLKNDDGQWQKLGEGKTNTDGRVGDLLSNETILEAGRYKVIFVFEDYFKQQAVKAFYPYAEVVFDITNKGDHYHIPLLLSPFGYSTYRGSQSWTRIL